MWINIVGRRITCSPSSSNPVMYLRREFSSEIFVSRLSFYTTDEEFQNVFLRFGKVKEARLIKDNRTQRPKGYGFVKYESEAEAQKALKAMNGRIIGGRLIFVELAKPRSEEDIS